MGFFTSFFNRKQPKPQQSGSDFDFPLSDGSIWLPPSVQPRFTLDAGNGIQSTASSSSSSDFPILGDELSSEPPPPSLGRSSTSPAASQTSYSQYVASLRSRIGSHEFANPVPVPTPIPRIPFISPPKEPVAIPSGSPTASPTPPRIPLRNLEITRSNTSAAAPPAPFRSASQPFRTSRRTFSTPTPAPSSSNNTRHRPVNNTRHTTPATVEISNGNNPFSLSNTFTTSRDRDQDALGEFRARFDREDTRKCITCSKTLQPANLFPLLPGQDPATILSPPLCQGCMKDSTFLERQIDQSVSTDTTTLETTQCRICRNPLESGLYPTLSITRDCDHAPEVCLLCIEAALLLSLEEGPSMNGIYCPHPTCTHQLDLEDIRKVVLTGLFNRFESALTPCRTRVCLSCHASLSPTEFPDPRTRITSECKHQPETCISCIENSIIRTLDLDLPELISCPQCGKGMENHDIWRFTGPEVFKRYEKMIRLNQDVECIVCAETLKGRDFPETGITETCQHEAATCMSCIAQHIRSQLETRTWNQLTCPECPSSITYADVQRFATPEAFQRYDTLTMRDGISTDANFRWCPSPGCRSGQIQNEGASAPIVTCVACNARSCFTHQRLWHEGLTCEEVDSGVSVLRELSPQERADRKLAAMLQGEEDAEEERARREREAEAERAKEARKKEKQRRELARHRAEEQASEATVIRTSRKCPGPNCSFYIEKNDGCDHMTCTRCSYEFCWVCLADWSKIRRSGNTFHERRCKYHSSNIR